MKLLITTGIFPPDIGGPATYVPKIAEAIVGRGHQVTVLALSDRPCDGDGRYSFDLIRLHRHMPKPWRWVQTVLTIFRRALHCDVILANGLVMETVLANLLLRRPMVQKIVGDIVWERATTRGWVADGFEAFQRARYGRRVQALKALQAWWIRRADRIIVPSRYLAAWVRALGVREDAITVIHNAVESVEDVIPVRVPLQAPVKLATVGRLIPLKHVDAILEVVARLDGVGLVIIGEGPEHDRLRMMANELGIGDRVYFAGARSRPETLSLMAGCDIFVLNSMHEGLPYSVLEAMSLGLPVVATAVGGTPEVVQDMENGRLIPPKNTTALCEAISGLILSPTERQCLAEGGRRTVQRFSFSRMLEETLRVLEGCLAG